MKKLIILIVVLIVIFFEQKVIAQTPKISFLVYLEDAKGRVDSVRFIYDSIFDVLSERKKFGYKNITNVPFDANFECRGADLGGQKYHSKIRAGGYNDWICEEGVDKMNSINIRAVDFPVRMYWDSTYFANDDCLDWSRFTRYFNFALHPWNDPRIYYKMSEMSEFIITKKWLLETEDFRNIYQHDVQGGGEDSIFVIFIGISSEFDGYTSTNDEQIETFTLSPNPANQIIRLVSEKVLPSVEYEIIHLRGNKVNKGIIDSSSPNIDVSNLESGMYYIIIKENDTQRLLKFIKL